MPLSPCFLGTYKWSTSAFGWCCPWMVSKFLVFISRFCSSSRCQSVIPRLYLSTHTANDPFAWILFFELNSVPKTHLNLLKYSLFNFSFSFLCCMLRLSSTSRYLNAFLGSSPLLSFSNVLPMYVLLWTLSFFLNKVLYTFLIQISYQCLC